MVKTLRKLLALMVSIRMVVQVRDLHHFVGFVMGINLMYNIQYLVGILGQWMVLMYMGLSASMTAIRLNLDEEVVIH